MDRYFMINKYFWGKVMNQGRAHLVKCLLSSAVICSVTALIVGCENAEDDKTFQAQFCLNQITSTNTDVKPCLAKIEGLQSQKASQVRCSAYYLSQGFYNPQRFADAMQAIGNSDSNPLLAMTGALAFTDKTSAQGLGFNDHIALADATYTACTASGSPGYAMFAVATRMGSKFSGAAPTINPDGSVDPGNLDPTNMTDSELGESAGVIFDTYCTGAQSSSSVCTEYNEAIPDANAGNDVVGCQLKFYLQNHTPAPDGHC
jgi:hypothetical protein